MKDDLTESAPEILGLRVFPVFYGIGQNEAARPEALDERDALALEQHGVGYALHFQDVVGLHELAFLNAGLAIDIRDEREGMQQRDIPFSVFHFDCYWLRALHWCDFTWDPDVFPDVKGMIQRYHDKGLKLCCWINPYVAQDTDMFREGAEKGYFLLRADGKGIKQVERI